MEVSRWRILSARRRIAEEISGPLIEDRMMLRTGNDACLAEFDSGTIDLTNVLAADGFTKLLIVHDVDEVVDDRFLKPGLVAFDEEQKVGPFIEHGLASLLLAMHGVAGHNRTFEFEHACKAQ